MTDLEFEDIVMSQVFGGQTHRCLHIFAVQLRICLDNLFYPCATGEQLEDELYADTCSTNTGFAAQYRRI